MPAVIDTSPWTGLVLGDEIAEGNRNQVWHGELDGHAVAVRRTRRAEASLRWEIELIDFLHGHGFVVPVAIATDDGCRSSAGIVVQQWIAGREPESTDDWNLIAETIQQLHRVTVGYAQRPGCCAVPELAVERRSGDADIDRMDASAASLVLSVFAAFADAPQAVVHGDVWAPNLRITPDGKVGLLDWDESRVDVTAHDLSPLGVQVLPDAAHAAAVRLSHAWEAANGWVVEPDYARRRLAAIA